MVMTRCIKVPLKDAESVKRDLIDNEWLATGFVPKKEDDHIFFSINENYTGRWPVQDRELDHRFEQQIITPFKDALAKVLKRKELRVVKTAHDIMGSIAIIEVPRDLQEKEKLIANTLLQSNPLIETVLKKDSEHEGVFRTQHMKFLAGVKTKTAVYKENNCTLHINVENVYFSPRLSTERKRIADQVSEGEDILVMFSGAAPYPCVLAKNTQAKIIVGVEINPQGHKQGLENVRLNKIKNVDLHCGDVREIVPLLNQTFDRIIMPLPKTAEEFLDVALPVAKPHAIIHLYGFYHEDEFHKAHEEVDKYCKAAKREYKIVSTTKVGQQSPRTYRICVDIEVLN